MKQTFILQFDTDEQWSPLGLWCYYECPFYNFTKRGHECLAKKRFIEKDGKENICPFYKGVLVNEKGASLFPKYLREL